MVAKELGGGVGWGQWELFFSGCRVAVWDDGKILDMVLTVAPM